MKKWIWILIILTIIFFILGWLYQQGYIKTNWQWLSIILAAAAGPFEFLRKASSGQTTTTKNILQRQLNRQDLIKKHDEYYRIIIEQKEKKIQQLQAQVNILQDKIDKLELEKNQVNNQVEQMDLDQLKDSFIDEFGT